GLIDPKIIPDSQPPEVDFSQPPEEIAYESVERIGNRDYTVRYDLWVENISTDRREDSLDLSIKVDTDARRYFARFRYPPEDENVSGSIYADDRIYWKKGPQSEGWYGEATQGVTVEEFWLLANNVDTDQVFDNIDNIRRADASVINETGEYLKVRIENIPIEPEEDIVRL
ncbi:MAG: hypothetical protein SXQ77_07145, partial [Halobacteria archaeon]|nr:hypothetical protein [Halobacteria archaeon]